MTTVPLRRGELDDPECSVSPPRTTCTGGMLTSAQWSRDALVCSRMTLITPSAQTIQGVP